MNSASVTCGGGFWTAENESLVLRVDAERAWFEVTDKRTGTVWEHDPWYHTVGELTVHNVATGTTHVCHLSDALDKAVAPLGEGRLGFSMRFERIVDNTADRVLLDSVSVACQIELSPDSPELAARVVSLEDPIEEWQLLHLAFPCRLGWFRTLDDAYLIVPWNVGLLLPGRGRYISDYDRAGEWADVRESLQYGTINMAMFGVVRDGAGMLGILDTPYDALLEVMGNYNLGGAELETTRKRLSSCYPGWRPSQGALRYSRRIRYQFYPQADYVSLAKAYRRDAIASGRFRSLDDKAEETPAVERLYGAPLLEFVNVLNFKYDPDRPPVRSGEVYDGYHEVETSFQGVKRCLQICHDDLGIERAQVYSYGINEGGPDVRYPDIFPINVEAGGEAAYRGMCDYVAEVGYVGPMADTYIHTYLDSPSFDPANLILQQGRLRRYMRRRVEEARSVTSARRPLKQWAGGTEHTHCGSVMLQFAQRNYPRLLEIAPVSGTYLDVITALSLNECSDPNHPMTRSEDAYWRHRLLGYMRSLGIVVDSEMAQEYALQTLDASHFWAAPDIGLPIPLWHLVYHDALICRHFVGPVTSYWGPTAGDYSLTYLRALLLGDSIMVLPKEEFLADSGYRDWLRSIASVVHRLHGEVANQEMVGHEFLTDDRGVQRTAFSPGTEVTVNLRMVGYSLPDGTYLPPKGYHIRLAEGDVLRGAFGHVTGMVD
jgi:hypothetical protein